MLDVGVLDCLVRKLLVLSCGGKFVTNYLKSHASDEKSVNLLKVVSAMFLLVCFICLKESTFETRKNIFYFTLKALFVLEIIRF